MATLITCGDWLFVKELGGGQFGKVTLWKNKMTDEKIAIKTCKELESSSYAHSRQARRWNEEIKQTRDIDHLNIVKYMEIPDSIRYGFTQKHQALGMEYCEEGDLRNMLSKVDNNCGLREYLFRDFMFNISSALSYLHSERVIHRDLKPENIVLKKDANENIIFKIIDLGYAKDISAQDKATSLVGTWHYIAPEFWPGQQGQEHFHTHKVDLWSLGLVTFECMTGRRPFYPFVDPQKVIREIPKKQQDHICTTFSMDPEPSFTFSSKIPEPNWLCEDNCQIFVPWLQNMLMLDPTKRGGSDWFQSLQQLLKQTEMVSVFNANTCKMLTFSCGSSPPLKHRLQRVMQVNFDDELICLFDNGQIPNHGLLIEKQCFRLNMDKSRMNGPPRLLYVFAKEKQHSQFPTIVDMPKTIKKFLVDRKKEHGSKLLQIFSSVIMYVNKLLDQSKYSLKSLNTLNISVKKLYNNCHEQGKKLCVRYNELEGSLKLALQGHINCVESYQRTSKSDQQVAEVVLLDSYCKSSERLRKFSKEEMPKLKENCDNICNPVHDLPQTLASNINFVDTNQERVKEKRRKWTEYAVRFRSISRIFRNPIPSKNKDESSLVEQANLKMRDLIEQVVTPLEKFTSDLIKKTNKLIENLISCHSKISSVLSSSDLRTTSVSMETHYQEMVKEGRDNNQVTLEYLRNYQQTLMRVYDAMVQYRVGYAEFTATNFYKQQREGVNGEIPNLVKQIDVNIRKLNETVDKLTVSPNLDYLDFLDDFDDNGDFVGKN